MKVGDKYTITQKVTDDMTAAKVGSGALNVFGTPYLLAMMENAAGKNAGWFPGNEPSGR